MSLEFYHEKLTKAKKEHTCEMCNDKIQPGEMYIYAVGKYDGDFFSKKLHQNCNAVIVEVLKDMNEDEYDYDMIADWWKDHYCYSCKKAYPECEPDDNCTIDCSFHKKGTCHANGIDCDQMDKVCWCTLFEAEEIE